MALLLVGCAAPSPPIAEAGDGTEPGTTTAPSAPANATVPLLPADAGWGWSTTQEGDVGVLLTVETNGTTDCEMFVGYGVAGDRYAAFMAGRYDGYWMSLQHDSTGSVDAAGESVEASPGSATGLTFAYPTVRNGSQIFAMFHGLTLMDVFTDPNITAAIGLTCDAPTRPVEIVTSDQVELFAISDFEAPADIQVARLASATVEGSAETTMPTASTLLVQVLQESAPFVGLPHTGTLSISTDQGDETWNLQGNHRDRIEPVSGDIRMEMTGGGAAAVSIGLVAWGHGTVDHELYLLDD